jgi:hypothetical protein
MSPYRSSRPAIQRRSPTGSSFFRGVGRLAEPCQRADIARRVLCQHTIRPAASGARAAVFDGSERNDHLLALVAVVEIGNRAPAYEAFGQVIGHVLDPREPEPFKRLQQLRPDALQRLDFGEQRIESLGAHDASATITVASLRVVPAQACG